MKLEVRRRWLNPEWTIGELLIDGLHECFTLEPTARLSTAQKFPGKTAIPVGTYPIGFRLSKMFRRPMPFLGRVPGFLGIMLHPGNSAKDTRGCILCGIQADTENGLLIHSRDAFDALYDRLFSAAPPITITVSEDEVVFDWRNRGAT